MSSFVGLPGLQRSLDRLELAGAELPGPALLRRCARDMRHALDPSQPLRAEHLEAEARAGRRSWCRDSPTCRPSCETASTWCRRCRSAPRGESSGSRRGRSRRRDRSSRRSHARPSARGRRAAPPILLERHAVGGRNSAFGIGHAGFDVLDGAELARLDAVVQLDHLRMEAAVVADADNALGLAHRVDRRLGLLLGEGEGLLAIDVLAGGGRGLDLLADGRTAASPAPPRRSWDRPAPPRSCRRCGASAAWRRPRRPASRCGSATW